MGGMELDFQGNQIPLFGNFIADPANEKKRGSMHNMALAYQGYRPEIADARLQALNNQMSMFAPLNAMLGQMYGKGAQFDASQALQNPMSARAMDMGAPTGSQMLQQPPGGGGQGGGPPAPPKKPAKNPHSGRAPVQDFSGKKDGGAGLPKEKFSPGRMNK